jgi:hypothetical protein
MCQNKLSGIRKYKIILSIIFLIVVSLFLLIKGQPSLQDRALNEVGNYIILRMSDCHKNNSSNQCYEANAEDFISRFKLGDIMDIFYKNEKTPEFFTKCHLTAHYLGQIAYKKYKSIPTIFAEANRACLGGVYHGAVEGYFMAQGVTDIKDEGVKEQIKNVCGVPKDYAEPQKFIECNHGLGHATMYLTENDLPGALDLCDALSSKNERDLCYTGALMANGDSFNSGDHPTKYIRDDDPLYPCPILKKSQQEQCYTYGVLSRFQHNLLKSIDICLSIPAEFKGNCFETIGRDRTMLSANPQELKSQCYQIEQDEWRKYCISGTAYNLVVRFGALSNIPIDYCGITDSKYKNNCYTRIFNALKNITTDKEARENFCKKIDNIIYKNQCYDEI